MPNQKITELQSLTAISAQPNDLTVVVDVSDTSSPSGNTKNMTLGQLSTYVTANKGLFSSSAQVLLNSGSGVLQPNLGGTGVTSLGSGVLTGQNGVATAISGTYGQTLVQGTNGPLFISNVVSSSAQISYPQISNIPVGIVSSSAQLPSTISSSGQLTFIGLKDVPASYTANAIVASNEAGTGLIFVTSSDATTPISDQLAGGRSICNGTYYFNGDIRERIYANPTPTNLYTGSYSEFFENFLHSGNIFYSPESQSIYFCRGTWPRRQGQNSSDLKGFTWREGNSTGLSKAEAICSTRDDGQNFQVILDLYATPIFGSQENSTQTIDGTNVVSEPSAVVYDKESNSIFFACRNDHDASIIYRIPASGSAQDMINNGVIWCQMASPNLKIDSIDIVTIPQNFYAVNNPAQNTRMLLFGVSPDYNAPLNQITQKNAAVFMVPTNVAPGLFQTDYPQAYVMHQFWGASLDGTLPNMGKTGVKGIKAYFANINGGEWNPDKDDPSLVQKENSRIYVVSSGAVSSAAITSANQVQPLIDFTFSVTTPAGSVPANPSVQIYAPITGQPLFTNPVDPVNVPTSQGVIREIYGNQFSGPSIAPNLDPTVVGVYNNVNFGGHAVLELLWGYPAGSSLTNNFSAQDDSNRQYKTWRAGILQQNGNITELNLGNDDPAQSIGTAASAPGAARGEGFSVNDRMFILTSPAQPNAFNSQVPLGANGCRGIVKIVNVNCSTAGNEGTYALQGGDGTTGLNTVMVIPILANTIDTDIGSMSTGGQQGLQQIAIDGINNKFYVADCFYSRYWTTVMNSVINPGRTTTNPFPVFPTPSPQAPATINFNPVPYNGNPIGYPPVPGLNSGITDPNTNYNVVGTNGGNLINLGQGPNLPVNVVPGNPLYLNPPTPGNPNFQETPVPNGNPEYNVNGHNPPTPGNPTNATNPYFSGYNPANFNPANYNPEVYTASFNPYIAGDPGIPSITTTNYQAVISEFGTIYEGDLFVYSRGINGQRIFDNANPQVAYSRPTGLAGYNVGPQQAFRLLYTNAENNFNLLPNSLGMGIYINGLSQTFVQDGVLAEGNNVLSVLDAGPGYPTGGNPVPGGLLVTMENPAQTSDYTLLAYSSDGSPLGTGQNHNPDPESFTGTVDVSYPQGDGAYYYSKNRSQFRITYGVLNHSNNLSNVIYFGCFEN